MWEKVRLESYERIGLKHVYYQVLYQCLTDFILLIVPKSECYCHSCIVYEENETLRNLPRVRQLMGTELRSG